jgi:cell division protein FtsL
MSHFHIVSKRIDNSRLVRAASPDGWRQIARHLVFGSLLAVVIFLYAWQHFQCIQLSYQMESLESQQAQLNELNHQLTLEAASLRSPARIDAIARGQLGMTAPAADQLQPYQAPTEPIFAEIHPADSARAR